MIMRQTSHPGGNGNAPKLQPYGTPNSLQTLPISFQRLNLALSRQSISNVVH